MKTKYLGNLKTREQWLEKALSEVASGSRILDAGAGELQYKRFCQHLNYVAQDFGEYNGEGNTNGLQTGTWDNSKLDIISDITKIPEDDASFDAIMCIEVFEHIPEPIKAIEEFSRLIKPGGTLIITAPVSSLTHFAPYYFYNGFSRYFYEKHLSSLGFEIIELTHNGNFYEYLIQETKRVKSLSVKYSDKKISLFRKFILKLGQRILYDQLKWLSQNDSKTHELHSFGIHVIARKK